jgi:two-component system invasion response regulator UvrY
MRLQMAETILIVDDHDTVRQALSRWLATVFHDCLIMTAATGEEALAIARDTPPQVVVMDFGLPGMNGAEATRRIKAIVPTARVVILTIHDTMAYRMDAADAGVSAYVLKEDMQAQLVPTLKTLMADCG